MVPGSLESWLVLRSLRTLNLVCIALRGETSFSELTCVFLTQRVTRQSTTATAFATWLNEVATNAPEAGQSYDGCPGGVLKTVWHAALQGLDGATGDGFNPLAGSAVGDEKSIKRPQMTGGPACFGILTTKKEYATWLPHKLKLMVVSPSCRLFKVERRILNLLHLSQPATSLGGVESLIEHRIISDAGADPCLSKLAEYTCSDESVLITHNTLSLISSAIHRLGGPRGSEGGFQKRF